MQITNGKIHSTLETLSKTMQQNQSIFKFPLVVSEFLWGKKVPSATYPLP